jgi:hypothetical protein
LKIADDSEESDFCVFGFKILSYKEGDRNKKHQQKFNATLDEITCSSGAS